MRAKTKDLSVILGCYNAAEHLERIIIELTEFLDRSYELLVV